MLVDGLVETVNADYGGGVKGKRKYYALTDEGRAYGKTLHGEGFG